MQFHVLASGSKGNATFIYINDVGILIDCGISHKQLVYRLEKVGFSEDDIKIVLLTHDHHDHDKNIHLFDPKICYSGFGCLNDIAIDHVLRGYKEVIIEGIHILPLSISHDATSPLAFIISNEEESILYMTDTGYVSKKNQKLIQNLDYYIIESNHDTNLLMTSKRPMYLKKRILSDKGHLDNEYSAQMMANVLGDKTKEIVLAHLSEECNTPEVAYQTYLTIMKANLVDLSRIRIKVASQIDIVSGGNYEG